MSLTLKQALKNIASKLELNGISTNNLDARLLVAKATGYSPEDFIKDPNILLTEQQEAELIKLTALRLERKPISHILKNKEFYGLDFYVTPDVLTPRPETELLVDKVLQQTTKQQSFTALELGVGSGAISVSICKHRPNCKIVGVDICKKALDICSKNMYKHGVDSNLNLLQSSWWKELDNLKNTDNTKHGNILPSSGFFDFILSNPPYIAATDYDKLEKELFFEPKFALTDELDGYESYRNIAKKALNFTHDKSRILVEIGINQHNSVEEIFNQNGLKLVGKYKDLAQIVRILEFSIK